MNVGPAVPRPPPATIWDTSPEVDRSSRPEEDRAPFLPYSSSASLSLLSTLLLAVIAISQLVPPIQSPDEHAHLSRAYLMSRGVILLETRDGMTGGFIDTGLIDYMHIFSDLPLRYHEKATKRMLRDARKISFTNEYRFVSIPNTALYFPVIYTPQAVAFSVGRLLSLKVGETYYLARTFCLVTVVGMLWLALRLYPVPLPILALFAMPMAIFQLGAPTLDGVSFGLSTLAGAIYVRAIERPLLHSPIMHGTLIISLMLLAMSRTHLIAMIWTPLALHLGQRGRMYSTWTCITIALSVLWILYITLTVRGFQSQDTAPTEILLYYLARPGELYSVTISTLTNAPLLSSYWRMFIGILGWLDTPLNYGAYIVLSIALAGLAILSLPIGRESMTRRPYLAWLTGTVISISLLFAFFLLTCTQHPATFIGGIQGRYFYHVAIFMAFSLVSRPLSSIRGKVGLGILYFIMMVSIVSTVPKLLGRYWMTS